MFESTITFIEQLLQNTIDLINDLLTANAIIDADEAIEAVTSLFLYLVDEVADLLESLYRIVAPSVREELDAIVDGLRRAVAALIHIISAQVPGITIGNARGIIAAMQQFFTNLFDDLIAALDAISNPPTPFF